MPSCLRKKKIKMTTGCWIVELVEPVGLTTRMRQFVVDYCSKAVEMKKEVGFLDRCIGNYRSRQSRHSRSIPSRSLSFVGQLLSLPLMLSSMAESLSVYYCYYYYPAVARHNCIDDSYVVVD